MNDGFPTGAFIPFLKQFPELVSVHDELVDKYESFYQHLGIFRDEMTELIRGVTSVDVLTGTDQLEYMP